MELHISVNNKSATYFRRCGDIVCGNKDYTVCFTFDSEWDSVTEKTARFIWNGVYADRSIIDGVCELPLLHNTSQVQVGVYGGDLHTTTSAIINCRPSILCPDAEPYADADKDYESSCALYARAAATSAQAAATSATEAAESAQAAATSATEAAESAQAAATSAEQAAQVLGELETVNAALAAVLGV